MYLQLVLDGGDAGQLQVFFYFLSTLGHLKQGLPSTSTSGRQHGEDADWSQRPWSAAGVTEEVQRPRVLHQALKLCQTLAHQLAAVLQVGGRRSMAPCHQSTHARQLQAQPTLNPD
jgi:hypothetical protein